MIPFTVDRADEERPPDLERVRVLARLLLYCRDALAFRATALCRPLLDRLLPLGILFSLPFVERRQINTVRLQPVVQVFDVT